MTWPLRSAAATKRSLSHCSAHGLRKSGQRLLLRRLYCRGEWRARPASTESGGLKNAIGPFLKERMQQRNIWSAIQDLPSRHAKEIRAQSIAGRMAVRGLYLPAQAPWLVDFVSELLSFRAGKHDDMVDCCGLLGQLLGNLAAGEAPRAKEPPKILSADATTCTVTLNDLFEAEEHRHRRSARIW